MRDNGDLGQRGWRKGQEMIRLWVYLTGFADQVGYGS